MALTSIFSGKRPVSTMRMNAAAIMYRSDLTPSSATVHGCTSPPSIFSWVQSPWVLHGPELRHDAAKLLSDVPIWLC